MIALLLFAGCSLGCHVRTIYRTASGLKYQIFPATDPGPLAAGSGATVKVKYSIRHGDTVIQTTTDQMPLYKLLIPGLIYPYHWTEALGNTRAGDSLVVEQTVDSLLKKGLLARIPAGWTSSDRVVTTAKVIRVFPFDPLHTDSLVRADKEAEAKGLLEQARVEGSERIRKYLTGRGLAATLARSGAYVQIVEPGRGPLPHAGSTISLQYQCATLKGHVLDANTDSSFHHPPVLSVPIGQGLPSPVIGETLRTLPIGTHARIYLPRGLGVSPAAVAQQGELPDDDIVWDIQMLTTK